MYAKIGKINFSPDMVEVTISYYLEDGEPGYDDYWHDVMDNTKDPPEPTGERIYRPFRSVAPSMPLNTTLTDVEKIARQELAAFSRALTARESMKNLEGTEIRIL